MASADITQAYDIWNVTGGPLRLYAYDPVPSGYTKQETDIPALNTVIPTGKNMPLVIKAHNAVVLRFWGSEGGKPADLQNWRVEVALSLGFQGENTPILRCGVGGDAGKPVSAACSPLIGPKGNVVALWDAPNKKITVGASDAQKQAALLNDLCGGPYGDALGIKCNYSDMTRTETSTMWKLPQGFAVQTNHQSEPSKKSYTVSDTVTQSTSYSLTAEASAKFMKIVNTAITAKWEKVTTESHTFTQTTTLKIPPGHSGYVCTSSPTYHYVGTLTVVAGNTTWTMPGVAVDTANPNGVPHIETWDTKEYLPGDPCEGFVRGTVSGNKGSA
ncbi:MAG: hypothetical protein LLG14_07555 [Nocardiaceae bacterium]|nr:hypothetical protein [Nocardiaceae bacterium]